MSTDETPKAESGGKEKKREKQQRKVSRLAANRKFETRSRGLHYLEGRREKPSHRPVEPGKGRERNVKESKVTRTREQGKNALEAEHMDHGAVQFLPNCTTLEAEHCGI